MKTKGKRSNKRYLSIALIWAVMVVGLAVVAQVASVSYMIAYIATIVLFTCAVIWARLLLTFMLIAGILAMNRPSLADEPLFFTPESSVAAPAPVVQDAVIPGGWTETGAQTQASVAAAAAVVVVAIGLTCAYFIIARKIETAIPPRQLPDDDEDSQGPPVPPPKPPQKTNVVNSLTPRMVVEEELTWPAARSWDFTNGCITIVRMAMQTSTNLVDWTDVPLTLWVTPTGTLYTANSTLFYSPNNTVVLTEAELSVDKRFPAWFVRVKR